MIDLVKKHARTASELLVGGGLLFSTTSFYYDRQTYMLAAEKWDVEKQQLVIKNSEALLKMAESQCIPGDPKKTERNLDLLREAGNLYITEKVCFLYADTSVDYSNFAAPARGAVTAGFGTRLNPITGVLRMHMGVDYDDDESSSVCATEAGKVLVAGTNEDFGSYITIRHSNNVVSRYTHLSERLVNAGDFVEKGHVIGIMGNTGMSTGIHLHFEVSVDDQNVDPLTMIKDTEFACP